MQVELFYFEGCPNWTVADQRLSEALKRVGREDVTIERRLVETPDQADKVGFAGSPTIRIEGDDPFATGEEQVTFACRVYTSATSLGGSPTVEQFVEVLSR